LIGSIVFRPVVRYQGRAPDRAKPFTSWLETERQDEKGPGSPIPLWKCPPLSDLSIPYWAHL
jgi:hypothetical protein